MQYILSTLLTLLSRKVFDVAKHTLDCHAPIIDGRQWMDAKADMREIHLRTFRPAKRFNDDVVPHRTAVEITGSNE